MFIENHSFPSVLPQWLKFSPYEISFPKRLNVQSHCLLRDPPTYALYTWSDSLDFSYEYSSD